jgi:hypothetical protein
MLSFYTLIPGSRFGDCNCIRGKEGTLFAQEGEGAPRWFFISEHMKNVKFDFYGGFEQEIRKGRAQLITPEGEKGKLPPSQQSDDSKYHLDNWIDCMRDRSRTRLPGQRSSRLLRTPNS